MLAVLILITATMLVSYILYSEVEENAIEYQYQPQEMYATQPVLSIQNFKHSLKFVSTKDEIIYLNTKSKAAIIPEIEVLEANRGFIIKVIASLGLLLLFLVLLGYFFYRQKRKTHKIIQEKDQKYKSDLEYLVRVRTDELNKLNESLRLDIIKRKEVEKKLKETVVKVAKSEKIKSDFLAQVSHEIRTPINTILSFSSLIKEELLQYADEELKYSFSSIQSAGTRLIRTIDLILNMSDIQAGTHDYIPKEIDICNDIIKHLATEYKVQINEKNLKLEIIEKSSNNKLIADSYSVNQIFANLIDNAIKYTSEGVIKIVCDRNNNDEVIVSVIDTGLGISQDYIPKLFEEFSQEDVGYTRKYEGNGLGLALVKKYCELNKAEISVKSQKGKGSKFTVKFSKN